MQRSGLQYSLTLYQISLNRIKSYKSSLTDALISLSLSTMVEPGRRHHSPLHPFSLDKILEEKHSVTSEILCTVIVPLLITKTI